MRQNISGVIVDMRLDAALLEYDPIFQDKIATNAVELLEQCLREYDSVLRSELGQLEIFWKQGCRVRSQGPDLDLSLFQPM